MEKETVDIYERHAGDWQARRPPKFRDQAQIHAARGQAVAVR